MTDVRDKIQTDRQTSDKVSHNYPTYYGRGIKTTDKLVHTETINHRGPLSQNVDFHNLITARCYA